MQAQSEEEELPAAESWFSGQAVQELSLVAAVFEENFPCEQGVHVPAPPLVLYVPAGQAEHSFVLPALIIKRGTRGIASSQEFCGRQESARAHELPSATHVVACLLQLRLHLRAWDVTRVAVAGGDVELVLGAREGREGNFPGDAGLRRPGRASEGAGLCSHQPVGPFVF
eukprot:746377-Hanusia_phi.AAC.3